MSQIQGRATIKKDGVALNTKNGATIALGGTPRAWVANDQRGGGYQEGETIPGSVTCTVLVDEDFRADGFDGTGLTIEFVADNGLVFVVREAFLTDPLSISAGECEVVYNGQPAVQL